MLALAGKARRREPGTAARLRVFASPPRSPAAAAACDCGYHGHVDRVGPTSTVGETGVRRVHGEVTDITQTVPNFRSTLGMPVLGTALTREGQSAWRDGRERLEA